MGTSDRRKFRHWTIAGGTYNLLIGLPLVFPQIYQSYYRLYNKLNLLLHLGGEDAMLPVDGTNEFFVNFSGLSLCVMGGLLIYAAGDPRNRSSIPIFSGISRIVSSSLLVYYAVTKNIPRILLAFIPIDLGLTVMLARYSQRVKKT